MTWPTGSDAGADPQPGLPAAWLETGPLARSRHTVPPTCRSRRPRGLRVTEALPLVFLLTVVTFRRRRGHRQYPETFAPGRSSQAPGAPGDGFTLIKKKTWFCVCFCSGTLAWYVPWMG